MPIHYFYPVPKRSCENNDLKPWHTTTTAFTSYCIHFTVAMLFLLPNPAVQMGAHLRRIDGPGQGCFGRG